MIDYDISLVLNYIKKSFRLTDEKLSEILNIDRTTLYNWKTENTYPSAKNMEMIFNYAYEKGLRMNKSMEQIYKEMYCGKRDHILFHGARSRITEPYSILKCEDENDFGRAMYFGESFDQSAAFVHSNKEGCVYINHFNDEGFKAIQFNVDNDWMFTIAYYRGYIPQYANSPLIQNLIDRLKGADYIVAPIADNNMFAVIEDFVAGNITDVQCQHGLSASNLGKQYVFTNQTVLDRITPLKLCYLSSAERKQYRMLGRERKKESDDKVRMAKQTFNGQGKYINQILE